MASALEETVDTLTTPKKNFDTAEQSGDMQSTDDGVPPPWHVEANQADKEGVLRAQILNLSQEKWTFMQVGRENVSCCYIFFFLFLITPLHCRVLMRRIWRDLSSPWRRIQMLPLSV